jgi:hypothetical protein
MKKEESMQNLITTKKVKEILHKEKYSLKLKRSEHLWFSRTPGVRRSGISFAMTKEERSEYIKCKLSVFYFAQKYCKIKRNDGKVGEIKLRDYQKDIIKLFDDNRYSILMASRQIGKCISPDTIVHVIDNKNITHEIPIYEIYYNSLKEYGKITFLDTIKLYLYRIYSLLK